MTFQELKINKSLQQALSETPFDKLTSIQEKSFSVIMSGADVVAIAQTGTGKTLAYLLPIIQLLPYSQEKHPRVIILYIYVDKFLWRFWWNEYENTGFVFSRKSRYCCGNSR